MPTPLHVLVITGLSGSGKHQVLYQLEDLGYFCMDNLPAPLLLRSIELLRASGQDFTQLAVGVDIRSGIFLDELKHSLAAVKQAGIPARILYLEASPSELTRRFSETRRRHPLHGKRNLQAEIENEQQKLAWLRAQADLIVDTTRLTPAELRGKLLQWLKLGRLAAQVTVSSFGYKFGVPGDADLVLDMRFLPNPFYVAALRDKNGKDPRVQKFILRQPLAQSMLKRMTAMIKEILPGYIREGKFNLHVALGCTGGQHRSVVMAEALSRRLPQALVYHRELQRESGEEDAQNKT